MGLYTWSAAERVEQCPASAVLPRVLEDTDDADRGRQGHSFLAKRIAGVSEQDALEGVNEKLHKTCRGIRLDVITAGLRNVRAEVSYAIDARADDVVELGVNINRGYDKWGWTRAAHVLCGTLDLEGERKFDDLPSVTDWKFGFQEVTPCKDNPQLMAEARARQLVTGAHEVEARIGYVRESGYVHFDRARFSRLELDAFADRQRATIAAVEFANVALAKRRRLTVNAGNWCRYCPSMPACPAYTALAKKMLRELAAMKKDLVAMTPAQQGKAWLKAKTILRLAKDVVDHLNAIAEVAPFPTEPGREVRGVTYNRERFDEKGAVTLLQLLGVSAEEVGQLYSVFPVTQHRELKVAR